MNKDDLITKEDLSRLKDDILSELSALFLPALTETQWLRSSEVMEMLKISSSTLQNLRISGQIPHTKIGGIFYYNRVDIENVLKANKAA